MVDSTLQGAEPKVRLVIIAAHHCRNNVAAQRFASMLRYFDPGRYDIHVVARSDSTFSGYDDHVLVHQLPGACVGDGLGRIDSMVVLAATFAPGLLRRLAPRRAWISQVIDEVGRLISQLPASRTILVATYSPVDALVAAKILSSEHQLPRLLDFRDGFAFESHGRRGLISAILRRLVECRVASDAGAITSVSRPLVEYFSRTYTNARVDLVMNGYDEAEHGRATSIDLDEARSVLNGCASGKFILGHFGRIGASDCSATAALEFLVDSIRCAAVRERLHLLFVGMLTDREIQVLRGAGCSYSVVETVDRAVAHAAMREVDGLLLLTGSRVGCATGKVFDYMISGPPIVCFSMAQNEAARILCETGCGKSIVAPDREGAVELLSQLVDDGLSLECDRVAVKRYSRMEQASVLERVIRRELDLHEW